MVRLSTGLSVSTNGQSLGRQQGTNGTNTVERNTGGSDFTLHYASK
jgi:hypothetical protein